MAKVFNTTGLCVPEAHYMVNIDERLKEIRKLVDDGKYFTISKARQYGKTTTLMALSRFLQKDYYVVLIDFQTFGSVDFETEKKFSHAFANTFLKIYRRANSTVTGKLQKVLDSLSFKIADQNADFTLRPLFDKIEDICAASDKPIVLMIDEVDSATNNQVFIDFLAQLRAQYLRRFQQPALKSVILAGVYDIRNLRQKIRPEDEHKYNSPWNIAADFDVDMSFSKDDIAGMLTEYENDYHTGMCVEEMACRIYDDTSGYPFLVSRLCQLMDEKVSRECGSRKMAWTQEGFHRALRMILQERNTLFDSLIGKLHDYPQLNNMLQTILFTGKTFTYAADASVIDVAAMFGFIQNQRGNVAIANRIFETRLYNFYLSEDEMQKTDIYKASLQDKNQFIVNGYLNY